MGTKHFIKGSLTLEPKWWRDPPEVRVCIDNHILFQGQLVTESTFQFDRDMDSGTHRLSVEFINKTDHDTQGDQDKAVIIKQIELHGISSPKFVWNGIYEPIYSQGWLDELIRQGRRPDKQLKYHDYLGWNGVWYLDFESPIFTWMHKVESLGWIYD